MDSALYNAAISGNVDVIFSKIGNRSFDEVIQLYDQKHNNILHLASLAGKSEAVVAILSKHPFLVITVNFDINSALHLAAKGGYTHVLRALIACTKELSTEVPLTHKYNMDSQWNPLRALIACTKQLPTEDPLTHNMNSWKNLLRLQNDHNDTAIHEATRYNHIEAVKLLLEQDPGFYPPLNKSEESLLYIAASRGFYDLVDLFINNCKESRCSGPCGRSALHGAIYCNNIDCIRRLLQWKETLFNASDDSGWTPLESAAYLGFGNLVSELLPVDSSKELKLASDALLTAASAGHISVMKELMLHRPSCWNNVHYIFGRNVLHVAIKHEKKEVIDYLLDECSTICVDTLLAQKDYEGNTALHLLVIYNCCVPKLIQHPMADKAAVNYKGFTPLDLAIYNSDNESSTSVLKNEIVEELKRAGAISHPPKSTPFVTSLASKTRKDDNEAERKALIRKLVDNHMIVAALIATVAFTAGFAMPGGYVSSGSPNAGTAVLSRNSVAFQTFVISDVVALLFSSSALFTYFISASFEPTEEAETDMLAKYAVGAMCLNMFGLGSIIIAFISGTYAVLHYSYALAIASSVVASCTFLIQFGIFVHFWAKMYV